MKDALERQAGLGDAIAWLRLRGGWTQQELAESAWISRIFLQKIEGGDRSPSAAALERLLRAVGSDRAEIGELMIEKPWEDDPNWEKNPRRRASTVLAYERSRRGQGTWSDPVKRGRRK